MFVNTQNPPQSQSAPRTEASIDDKKWVDMYILGKLVKLVVFIKKKLSAHLYIGQYFSSYLLNEACPGSCELGAAFEPAGA